MSDKNPDRSGGQSTLQRIDLDVIWLLLMVAAVFLAVAFVLWVTLEWMNRAQVLSRMHIAQLQPDPYGLLVISCLAAAELGSKYFVYRRLPSIKAVSVDVVILSLGYRVAALIQHVFFSPDRSWPTVQLDLVILAAALGCYWMAAHLFRDQLVDRYRRMFREKVQKCLASAKLTAVQKKAVATLLATYKHPELWGVFNHGSESGKTEFDDINAFITGVGGSTVGVSSRDAQLKRATRAWIIAGLALAASFAFLANGVSV